MSGELIGVDGIDGYDLVTSDFRVFDYGDALPAYVFAPLLLILILVPAFFALYAGFASARANGAKVPLHGALYGALVGPLWAVAMALLNALTQDIAFGQIVGDSLFVVTLLGGSALGALGGLGSTLGNPAEPGLRE